MVINHGNRSSVVPNRRAISDSGGISSSKEITESKTDGAQIARTSPASLSSASLIIGDAFLTLVRRGSGSASGTGLSEKLR